MVWGVLKCEDSVMVCVRGLNIKLLVVFRIVIHLVDRLLVISCVYRLLCRFSHYSSCFTLIGIMTLIISESMV